MLKDTGIFRFYPTAWTFEPPRDPNKSQAACIAFELRVGQKWYPRPTDADPSAGVWDEPWPDGYTAYMRSWVIGKDGTMNEGAFKALAECGLWNGDFDAIAGPPQAIYFIATHNEEVFEGKSSLRADWPQPNADVPRTKQSGFKPVDSTMLAQYRARFGTAARALLATAPAGAPAAPPPAPTAAVPAAAPPVAPAPVAVAAPAPAAVPPPAVAPAAAPVPPPAMAPPAAPQAVAPAVAPPPAAVAPAPAAAPPAAPAVAPAPVAAAAPPPPAAAPVPLAPAAAPVGTPPPPPAPPVYSADAGVPAQVSLDDTPF